MPKPAQPATVPAERQLTVYFAAETPDHTDFGLVAAPRRVQATSPTAAAEAALQALAAGPTAAEKKRGMIAPLPKGTRLLSVRVEKEIATADFSRELQANFNGGARWEEVVQYSIVNTLTSIDGIRAVRLRIAGETVESIGGHLLADELLKRSDEIIIRGKK